MPYTIHKIDMDRLKMKASAKAEPVSRVEQGFNIYWCDENPALFGAAVQRLLLECPPDKWNVTIKPAHMPGETWNFTATRKE